MAARPPIESAKEYARGVAGGLLFSIPLLYTMEVWWTGLMVDPLRLLTYVVAGLLLLFGYNYYAGLHQNTTFLEEVFDAVEELGLGLLVAALVLWLLGRITPQMDLRQVIGQVVAEAVVVAIGISVGKEQLGGGKNGQQAQQKQDQEQQEEERSPSVGEQLVIGLCGAVLVSANVAPTQEVIVIATAAPPWKILGLALFSIAVGAGILYYSDFTGTQQAAVSSSGGLEIFLGIAIMYASALVASGFFLWFFGRLDEGSLTTALAEIVVLGVTATRGPLPGGCCCRHSG